MTSWWNQAACLDHDPEEFFPAGAAPNAQRQISAAKQVCSRCPVRDPCVHWALETGADGVWGGLTEEERHPAKRRSRKRPNPHSVGGSSRRQCADGAGLVMP